ncbi:hypothetical protein D3C72_1468640 [compost metagenome]
MPTKALNRFIDRVVSYESDLELSDVLIRNFLDRQNSQDSIAVAVGVDVTRYPRLANRVNTRNSRNIVGLHLKRTLYIGFVKELYEDFADYLSTSLARAALAGVDPSRFVGEVKLDLHATEIIGAGSWDAVVKLMSEKIFRALENERSTITLIDKIGKRLGLRLEKNIVDAAIPYLDARHILVHRDGLVDDIYRNKYPDVALDGDRIVLNHVVVGTAKQTIRALAEHIDQKLLDQGLVRNRDIAGQRE